MEAAIISKILVFASSVALSLMMLAEYFLSPLQHVVAPSAEIITASISSVWWREEGLKQVVSDILPQVDRLNVFLQGYQSIPPFLNNPKITVLCGQDYPEALDRGSNAKFFWAQTLHGYHFIIDDDIFYPADYVHYCIQKIEQYHRTVVVGFHGIQLKNHMQNYFNERIAINFRKELKTDTSVHILGTGALAYHTDTIKINFDDFVIRNEDAVHFAICAQMQQVPLICIQRPEFYLKPIEPTCYDPRCVYQQTLKDGGATRLALIRSYSPWKLHGEEMARALISARM